MPGMPGMQPEQPKSKLPLIIGGIAGVLVLILIGVGAYWLSAVTAGYGMCLRR